MSPLILAMKNKNPTLQLRYAHADHTRVLRDVRRNRLSEIIWSQVYYVGFRISADGVDRYRHALLLADNYDALLDGIAGEFNAIREQSSAASSGTIRLVFMRNLMTNDPEVMASAECQNITTEIRDELSRQDDSQYLVFGMVGTNKICLIKVAVGDALLAIHQARSASMDQFKAEFTPLEVCQAHPVTVECYALFDAAAERIKPLVSSEPLCNGYRHWVSVDVYTLTQFFTRLEVRNILGKHKNDCASLWIASFASRAMVDIEAAESANFDPPSSGQRARHPIENSTHDKFDILGSELCMTCCKLLDQF